MFPCRCLLGAHEGRVAMGGPTRLMAAQGHRPCSSCRYYGPRYRQYCFLLESFYSNKYGRKCLHCLLDTYRGMQVRCMLRSPATLACVGTARTSSSAGLASGYNQLRAWGGWCPCDCLPLGGKVQMVLRLRSA